MAHCLGPVLLLLLLLLGSASSAAGNRCVDAAEACTANALCHRLRTEYVAQCLGRVAHGRCSRSRCHRALRRFFSRGPQALTHALLFCPCTSPACAERRRQTFVPACAFSGLGGEPPSCLAPMDACERSLACRPRLLAFQASCASAPSSQDGCLRDQGPSCLRAYARLAPRSPPTTWTTRARAWLSGATAKPAETGMRSAKPSGDSLLGIAAWMVPYNPLTVNGPQSCRTSWIPTATLDSASYRCPLPTGPWKGASCSPYSLSWFSRPCSD